MRSSRSAGCATPGPSSWPRANRQSRASSRGFSSAGRRPSGTCTSSRWIRRRAGWARDEGLSRNRIGSSGLAGPTGCSPRCRETTIRRCACSSPSGWSGSPGGSCGGGIAGAGSPCRCGCSWLPTRSSSRALSPTSLPRRLKRPPGPRDRRGSSLTHGWIIDAYGDYDRDSMVLWLWNERGAHRIEDPRVVPTFFLHAPPSDLPAIRRRIEILDDVKEVREVSRRIALEDDEPKPVLEIGARVDEVEIDGDEETILKGIDAVVRSKDPDVLMTDGGDAFLMPYLAAKASELGVKMQLGRDPDRFAGVKAKSYFTYGKIVYKPGQYILRGRLHLDRGHFAFRESDFAGLAELSRLSTLTPQEQARLTPGTAFSAMQVNQAYHDGCLVVWKKNRPEDFKDAENLLHGDRGGFTFEPEVGVHEGLYELDFSSLYPSIMVKYNISAETLDCSCCRTDGISVPELRYHLCTRRVGIVGRVLRPLIERRRYYKKMKKEPGPLQEVYAGRDTILKWTLVTCLDGRTVIPHKMAGQLYLKPISEIIDPLLPKGGMADAPAGLRLFGFDSNLIPTEKKAAKVLKVQSPPTMLRIGLQRGQEIVATPNHRFFVLNGKGGLDVRRADELHVGDFLTAATDLPQNLRSIHDAKG